MTTDDGRVITKKEAAALCRLTPQGFGHWVKTGKMPGPIPGTRRWDRKAIDMALDQYLGLESSAAPKSSLERWKERRNARQGL